MLHTFVVVEPPPADVLPLVELEPLPDEDDPLLVDEPAEEDVPPLPDVLAVLPDEALGGFAQDSLTPTILKTSLVEVAYVPADGVCVHTFQLEACTTERRSSLASAYVTDATWCPRESATAFARFHPP